MLINPVAYDPLWPQRFDAYAERIRRALESEDVRIDHIGSTAVPGLIAKPVIDIQIGVDDLDAFDPARLTGAGFTFVAGIIADEPPAFETQESAQWRKKYFRLEEGEKRLAHIHVRQRDQRNFRLALLYRDYLRANPAIAALFGEFKSRIAAYTQSDSHPGGTGPYQELKDPVVHMLIHQSEIWAAEIGWKP